MDEHERRVVAPLEEPVDESLGEQGEYQSKCGADACYQQSFQEDLRQDPADRQTNESKHADSLTTFVDQHDRQCEQEHRGGDDRDGGDGEVKTFEHTERARRRAFAGRPRHDAGHRVLHRSRERAGIGRVREGDVDAFDVFGPDRHIRRSFDVEQLRQVQSHFPRYLAEPFRIRRRLVNSRHAKFARPAAVSSRPQPDRTADREMFGLGKLAGYEDLRESLSLRDGGCEHQQRRTQEQGDGFHGVSCLNAALTLLSGSGLLYFSTFPLLYFIHFTPFHVLSTLKFPLPPLKDRIRPDLVVLFVGINPGVRSSLTGHHFAGYSNRFWKLLFESGLVPERIGFADDIRLPEWGYGITNIVPRPTPGIDTLTRDEYDAGRAVLRRKIARYRPRVVALVGVTVFRALCPEHKGAVEVGLQARRIGSARVFVLPNPSGRNANFTYAEMLSAYRKLRRSVKKLTN